MRVPSELNAVEVTPSAATYTLFEGDPIEIFHHRTKVKLTRDTPARTQQFDLRNSCLAPPDGQA